MNTLLLITATFLCAVPTSDASPTVQPAPVADATKLIVGAVVTAGDGTLVITSNGKQRTIAVPETATVTKDGKPALLADLKQMDKVTVKVKQNGPETTAVSIIARSAF